MGSFESIQPDEIVYLATLATAAVVVVGSIATPIGLHLARPLYPLAARLARRAGWAALKSALERGVRWVAAILTAGVALALVLCVLPGPAIAGPVATTEMSAAAVIEQTIARLKSAKKPLPAWVIDLALRAVDLYKTHQNGKRVGDVEKRTAEVEAEVISILNVVADVQARVEAGVAMSDREFRLTRELLDAHARRLDDLTGRTAISEAKIAEHEKQLAEYRRQTAELREELRKAKQQLAAQAGRFGRQSTEANTYYDPTTGRRKDAREKVESGLHQVYGR